MVGVCQAALEITNDRAQEPRCEQPRPEGTGPVLPDGWEQPQGGSDRFGHVTQLPLDLLTDGVWPIGGGTTGCLGGIRGGAQGVGAHMWDGCGLSGRSGCGRCCRSAQLTSGARIFKTAADRFRNVKLATSEGSRPRNGLSGTAIPRSLCLEQSQHPLRAGRRPHSDDPPVSFAQRLRRAHVPILPRVSALGLSMPQIGNRAPSSASRSSPREIATPPRAGILAARAMGVCPRDLGLALGEGAGGRPAAVGPSRSELLLDLVRGIGGHFPSCPPARKR